MSRWALTLWSLVILVVMGGLGAAIVAAEKPTGSLEGQVLLHAGDGPLAGATVTLYGKRTRKMLTDRQGRFRFDRVEVGEYQVSARARGYQRQWHNNVLIEDGLVKGGVSFHLYALKPALYVAQYRRVFMPQETVRIGLRGTLVETLHAQVEAVDRERLLTLPKPFERIDGELPPSWTKPIKRWSQPVEESSDGDDWLFQNLQMPKLAEGLYRLTVRGESRVDGRFFQTPRDTYWFSVSKMGLVTKRSKDRLIAFTCDLRTGEPLANAEVLQLGSLRSLGRTNRNGLLDRPWGPEQTTLVAVRGDSWAQVQGASDSEEPVHREVLYTDRPIYRPAQTVFFKGVVRERAGAENRLPQMETATLVAHDVQGDEIKRMSVPVNSWGSFNGEFELPQNPPLGEYTLAREGSDDVTTFRVEAYRKPEFKLTIQPATARLTAGGMLEARVQASYYFGAPVAKAKLRYTVYRRESWNAPSSDEGFFAGFLGDPTVDDYWSGYGDVVTSGDGVTDDQGAFHVSVATDPLGEGGPGQEVWDRRYTIEVEAEDSSHRLVTGRESVLVTQGEWRLEASTDKYIYAHGETAHVTVKALDYKDQAVNTTVNATLYRQVDQPDQDGEVQVRYDKTLSRQVPLDGAKGGRLDLVLAESGGYVFVVTGKDHLGNTVTRHEWLWVGDGEYANEARRYNTLQLMFDKKVYAPGDVCKVLINAPVAKGHVLLTLEGQRLHEAKLIPIRAGLQLLELPVEPRYGTNVYVSAVMVHDKSLHEASRSLNIDPSRRFLTLDVQSDKGSYEPGETANLVIRAMDHRKLPVEAELSVGIVDQAIYALAPDGTPDLRRVFWGPEENRIHTAFSFGEDYSGGPPKDQAQVQVRRNFKDTALWLPQVRTNSAGEARVQVVLPDNLTTWVVTVRGHTPETLVGSQVATFVATKPLLARLILPRQVRQNDEVEVTGLIHNYTDKQENVRVQLFGWSQGEQRLTIDPQGVGTVVWRMKADRLGTYQVRLVATGQNGADALELPLPVLPHGVPEVSTQSGRVAETSQAWELKVPASTLAGTASAAISVTPTPLGALNQAMAYLRQYDYGCVEQTLSRFVPELKTLDAKRALGIPAPAADRELIQAGLRHLSTLQHPDGGWGWWVHDRSDVRMTAHVLAALAEAEAAGWQLDAGQIRRAVSFLRKQSQAVTDDTVTPYFVEPGTGWETQALVQYALSRFGAATQIDALIGKSEKLSDYGLALVALSLPATHPAADGLVARLASRAVTTGDAVHWERLSPRNTWMDSATEATAYALRALLKHRPDDSKVAGAVRYLMQTRQGVRWRNTRETGLVVLGLADAVQRLYGEAFSSQAKLVVDDRVVGEWDFAGRPDALEMVVLKELAPGTHRVVLETTGSGPVWYASELTTFREGEPLLPVPGAGVNVERRFFNLPPEVLAKFKDDLSADAFDQKAIQALTPVSGRTKRGEWVLVALTVHNTQALDYVLIEDPLPAGWEVMTDNRDSWGYWWSHREIKDDRVALFVTHLSSGDHTLYYVARPEVVGRVHQMPTRLEQMYRPEVQARGGEAIWEVVP